jgi:hypothetical protein
MTSDEKALDFQLPFCSPWVSSFRAVAAGPTGRMARANNPGKGFEFSGKKPLSILERLTRFARGNAQLADVGG